MFEPTSRYASIKNAMLTTKDGRVILYKKRRFLPRLDERVTLQQVVVNPGDRLDLIAARTFGDPEQFWRICDVNDSMYPPDLTDLKKEPDKELQILVPVG